MSDDTSDFYDEEDSGFEFEDEYEDDADFEGNEDFNDEDVDDTGSMNKKDSNTQDNGVTEPDWHPWTLKGFIQQFFIEKAENMKRQQLPQCSLDEILIMLSFNNWQSDNVINGYYDGAAKFRDRCGLPQSPSTANIGLIEVDDFDCDICAESYSHAQVYALSCNHRYCLSCYMQYIRVNTDSGTLVSCMNLDCPLTVPYSDAGRILKMSQETKLENAGFKTQTTLSENPFLVATAKKYIDSHRKSLKWCPAADCTNVIEVNRDTLVKIDADLDEDQNEKYNPDGSLNRSKLIHDCNLNHVINVCCPDSHEFCYKCHRENHLPCPCWIVDLWIQKCKDDSETANWLQVNTHPCPKCDSSIEKNGGCNHMTCRKCTYEFCWICLNSWKEHGTDYYKCNRFDPEVTKDSKKSQEQSKSSLRRYIHFYNRFAIHESSMKGDQKVVDKVDEKMKTYMELELKQSNDSSLSWIDVQFLHDSIKALTNGRKTLKWTYCFAYHLEDTNFSQIFESMQDFLNSTVEDLSKIFEVVNDKKNATPAKSYQIISKHKKDIISLSRLVVQRQKLLIDCAQSGLAQGLLKFSEQCLEGA